MGRIPLTQLGPTEGTTDVVVTASVPPAADPREGLEEPMRQSLAANLAPNALKAIEERATAEGRRPVGLAGSELQYVDDAYRLTLSVLMAEAS